jgi:hypothetical protein
MIGSGVGEGCQAQLTHPPQALYFFGFQELWNNVFFRRFEGNKPMHRVS